MSEIVRRTWKPVGYTGDGHEYDAFLPDPVADLRIDPEPVVQERIETAARLLGQSDGGWAGGEPVARLLLRAEGIASSDIEGLRVPTSDLMVAQLQGSGSGRSGWILDNIALVEAAVRFDQPLTIHAILEWHAALMRHSPLPAEYVGRLRTRQNWIGGPNPASAVFVPPPPEHVPGLMDDLIVFANRSDLPGVVQTALLHGQFETIHPFADGNGRIGRVLIGWCLRRRRLAGEVVMPISPVIARNTDHYIAGLHDFRNGHHDRWITWFTDVCIGAAQLLERMSTTLDEIVNGWQSRLSDLRADATALAVLPLLAEMGAVDVATVADHARVSIKSARAALAILEERRIVRSLRLRGSGRGRPPYGFIADDIVELIDRL